MLEDICMAVDTTVGWIVGNDPQRARDVLTQYPAVLCKCDKLQFDDPAETLAYLILHLPDRFSRMFQILGRLLTAGSLPIGKSDNFAAIDIGAGPGPGMFAIRSFYATLAHYTMLHDPSGRVATLAHSDVVERSSAMPWIMHRFAEALVIIERGRTAEGYDPTSKNPCAAELERSRTLFGARYRDFSGLDIREEHTQRIIHVAALWPIRDYWQANGLLVGELSC
jgi:hypothetical protein